jgi:hypothetical protein
MTEQEKENHPPTIDQVEEKPVSLLGEFWLFLCENKKFWLLPILILLLLLGLLIILGGSSVAPFIYTLF